MPATFGTAVRDLRRLAGLARPELAARLREGGLNVPAAWIGRIERDEMGAALSERLVRALADVLGGDADALWASAQATTRASVPSPPPAEPEPEPEDSEGAQALFLRALTQWLASQDYAVGFSPDAPAGFDASTVAETAADWMKTLAGTVAPMAITGGASAADALEVLVPFLPHCDLLAYRSRFGEPFVLPVVLADGLTADDVRQRLATLRDLTRPLVAYGLGFNGQGMAASVTPLFVYFDDAAYESDDGAGAVLAAGYRVPTAREAASGTDRTKLVAGVVHVPAGLVLWAEPPKAPPPLVGRLAGLVKRGLEAVGVETDIFTADDLRTVRALADHYAR